MAFPAAANILPQISNFHGGEQKDWETFQDWREHFEAVTQLAGWDEHYKLVYGGHRLDITAQVGVTLTRGKSEGCRCSHSEGGPKQPPARYRPSAAVGILATGGGR